MDTTKRHRFRCSIPDGSDRERRLGWLRDWAKYLASSADVHFSTEVTNGGTVCELLYEGDETPRQFATMLKIATGEAFEALPPEEARADTNLNAAARPPEPPAAPGDATDADRSGQVSLMITRAQRRDLRNRGYSDEEIRTMTPAEAHRNLGLIDKVAP
jgi:hypothetical protein